MTVNRKPSEEYTFDLVVAGGGLAGLCAAIAAARHGLKTAIVQDRPVFGGNSSSEIRVVPYGCSQNNAWTNETGISHEFILEDRASNHIHMFDHAMTNTHYDMTLREMVRREPNLTPFLNTSIRGVDWEQVDSDTRRINAVHGSQLGSEREYIFRATQFVDATGDATVGYLAGAEYRYGREARSEFNENLAPIEGDDGTMGASITFLVRDIGRPMPYSAPHWAEKYTGPNDIGPGRPFWHVMHESTYGAFWWIEVCDPFHQIDDAQAIREELHKHALGVWDYIKNRSPYKERAATFVLEWLGMIPGKRESRRLVGDVTVTEHDCHNDRKWPDGVAYAGWWIDLHMRGGIKNTIDPGERENTDENYKHWIRISPFTLPLRAFYSRNVQNLWMAGRILSVTHVALGPVRVQLSLALAGQSVGTAAAYAIKHQITPREAADPDRQHIAKIRQQLLKDDIHVLGLQSTDPADLALGAKVSATSAMLLELGEPQFSDDSDDSQWWLTLDRTLGQVVPITHDHIDSVAVYLKNEGNEKNEVVVEVFAMERIWDRLHGQKVGQTILQVPACWSGWLTAPLNIPVKPDRSHRIVLRKTPGIHWARTSPARSAQTAEERAKQPLFAPAPTGTVAQYLYECPGGPESKNNQIPSFQPEEIDLPAYEHWRQFRSLALATRVTPQPQPFEASAVNNGKAWPETMPNVWISDPRKPLPQSVDLTFGQPQSFNEVLLSFDTNLDLPTSARGPLWRAAECVRDWRLHAKVDDEWQMIYEETGNYQRRRTAQFDRITATAIRLEVLATNCIDPAPGPMNEIRLHNHVARVFEIRVYDTEVT